MGAFQVSTTEEIMNQMETFSRQKTAWILFTLCIDWSTLRQSHFFSSLFSWVAVVAGFLVHFSQNQQPCLGTQKQKQRLREKERRNNQTKNWQISFSFFFYLTQHDGKPTKKPENQLPCLGIQRQKGVESEGKTEEPYRKLAKRTKTKHKTNTKSTHKGVN